MTGSRLRAGLLLLLAASLAGCAAAVPAPSTAPPPRRPAQRTPPPARPAAPPPAAFRVPQVDREPGLESVIQRNAATLVRQFGPPRLDVREGDMRKLQWTGQSCVLDAFLYPLQPGAEPVATYVEARRASDGQEVDKAACVAAMPRR